MRPFLTANLFAAAALLSASAFPAPSAHAQEQEAGNEASTNAEETFQSLVAQCDNTDALILRASIRLQLGRTTPEARDQAQTLLDKGLAQCGEGDIPGALATLTEAKAIASAGVDEVFAEAEETEVAEEEAAATETETPVKPWWQFW